MVPIGYIPSQTSRGGGQRDGREESGQKRAMLIASGRKVAGQAPKCISLFTFGNQFGLVASECRIAFVLLVGSVSVPRPSLPAGRAEQGWLKKDRGVTPVRSEEGKRGGPEGCSRRREENVCADLPSLGPATLRACAWAA